MRKKTIVLLPNSGSHVSSFIGLARALKERGHEVLFMTYLDERDAAERHGFEALPLNPDGRNVGWMDLYSHADEQGRARALNEERRRMMSDHMFHDPLADVLERDPALFVIDPLQWPYALAARRHGIPVYLCSAMLPLRLDRGAPLWSAVSPLSPCLGRAVACANATWIRSEIWVNLHMLAHRCGYDPAQFSIEASVAPRFGDLPTISLVPDSLDFPGADRPDLHHYVAPFDHERVENVPPELVGFLEKPPLVYVSLGGRAFRYRHARHLVAAIVDVMRQRRGWQAVFALSPDLVDSVAGGGLPDNVYCMSGAPQLWLLRRSQMFVTHGGVNGMLEGIEYGVPMLVVPQDYDQPGNAARCEFHGCGIHLPPTEISAGSVLRHLDTLTVEAARFAARLTTLRERIASERTQNDRVIERIEQRANGDASRRERRPRAAATSLRRGWMLVDPSSFSARHGPLAAGARMAAAPDQPLQLGYDNIVCSPDLHDALQRGTGPWLVRVEIGGESQTAGPHLVATEARVISARDVSEDLHRFVWWCIDEGFRMVNGVGIDGNVLLEQLRAALQAGLPVPAEVVAAGAEIDRNVHAKWHPGWLMVRRMLNAPRLFAAQSSSMLLIMSQAIAATGAWSDDFAARFEPERVIAQVRLSEQLESMLGADTH